MPVPPARDPGRAGILEEVYAEWFAHACGVPGVEVHADPDVTWKVGAGSAWANAGVRLRLEPQTASSRLDEILGRYRRNGRGAAFWVGPGARPANLESLLRSKGMRCRMYLPAMYCDLREPLPELEAAVPLEFVTVSDYEIFRTSAHPYHGPVTTKARRFALTKQKVLAERYPRRSWELMALYEGCPAGICTVFLGSRHAGLFDAGVVAPLRRRGIAAALVRRACAFARGHGVEGMVLISTKMGQGAYGNAGFAEIAKFAFWYTAKP